MPPRHGLAACLAAASLAGAAHAAPTFTILHTFHGQADGAAPNAGVTIGPKGELYGTTPAGGWLNNGTVFELHRTTGGIWQDRVIYFFRGRADGAKPLGGVILGPYGKLYGTASTGGYAILDGFPANGGTVFSLTPPSGEVLRWTPGVVHAFTGQPGQSQGDGCTPTGKLLLDTTGALHGSASDCGTDNSGVGITNNGVWFKLTLRPGGQRGWQETFTGFPFSQDPIGGLIQDSSGRIYGASRYGNLLDGTVYFSTGATSWYVNGRYNLNGNSPSDPIIGTDGALYATTQRGGSVPYGGVIRIPLSDAGATPGTLEQIYNFSQAGLDGQYPNGPLAIGPNGTYLGTTSSGGANGLGTIFQLTPPAPGAKKWTETVLYNFDATASSPSGPLTKGLDGAYYGTTTASSAAGSSGTVFAFAL